MVDASHSLGAALVSSSPKESSSSPPGCSSSTSPNAPPCMECLFDGIFSDPSPDELFLPRSVFASIPIPETPRPLDRIAQSLSIEDDQWKMFVSPPKPVTPACVFKGKVKSAITDSTRTFLADIENARRL